MQFLTKRILAILALIGVVAASPLLIQEVSHKGTKVLRLDVQSKEDVALVKGLVERLGLDTWTHGFMVNSHVDVAVPLAVQPEFFRTINAAGLRTHMMHEDLHAAIEEESKPAPDALTKRADGESAGDPNWFKEYHPYEEHLKYLQSLVSEYPGNAEIVISGSSTEGRNITGIHIWGTQKGQCAYVIHSNVHAREWISSKVTEYFAYAILQTTGEKTSLAESCDFYIFPIVNPDGFVYSQTTNRMWRKNRLPGKSKSCTGTDINRNWDFQWSTKGGASTSECAEDYKGASAGNTVEFQSLSGFIKKLHNVKLFIDYHSYSQLILSPWGYTCNTPAPDNDAHVRAMKAWEAGFSKRYKTHFTYGPSCTTIYPTTGDSTDYTYGALKIVHSYSVELRDTGRNGFILPKEQIVPSGQEALDGLMALVEQLKKEDN
ncbi:hypothetical protein Dda_6611 [Drechslerella dactyloides]|uniref:Carboxypeptidase M14A n=1 Tax=Drechslerella dactyloides TaxID=74499 RepID=A0AAD6NHK1_DREDA|nr:hypothetical protein Dda_6611 [Drechslerella dactyloides]